ncbi:MAG TPA: hypothetical protein V6D14_35625 [Coleofasciculaceae cyanobacterium]|jgi:hypothetical protein
MRYLSNKRWFLPLITGASLIVSWAGVTQALPPSQRVQPVSSPLSPNNPAAKLDPNLVNVPAMPEPKSDNRRTFPLSPNDPDAKLDPNLINVPAIPEPTTDNTSTSDRNSTVGTGISYDVRTGSTQVDAKRSVRRSGTSTQVSPPSIGADSNISSEPELSDSK